jgi:hypothetical protein
LPIDRKRRSQRWRRVMQIAVQGGAQIKNLAKNMGH